MAEAAKAAVIVLSSLAACAVVIGWIFLCAHMLLDRSQTLYWVGVITVPMLGLWAIITVAMLHG